MDWVLESLWFATWVGGYAIIFLLGYGIGRWFSRFEIREIEDDYRAAWEESEQRHRDERRYWNHEEEE